MIKTTLLLLSLMSSLSFARGLAAEIQMHGGWASPMGNLNSWVESAPGYHTRFFVGANVNKGGISRAGYALDLTFSNHNIRNEPQGYYTRLAGDFIFFPLSAPLYTLSTGISWVMTDVFAPETGLDELSFRPGFMVDFTLHLPLSKSFSLNAKTRYDWVMEDLEAPREGGTPIDITGSLWYNLVGFTYQF